MSKLKPFLPFILIGVLFLLATNAAYISLYLRTPENHVYTGVGLESAGDKLVYYSMIEQGRKGELFMKNLHTSELQKGALFSPHWFVIGMTSSLLNISPQFSYHIYRVLLSVVFLWLLYLFVSKLFSTLRERLIAYVTVLFASGLGWFYLQIYPEISTNDVHWMFDFQQTPADVYITEMNTFTSFVQSPLFMLSYILILGLFYVYSGYLKNKSLTIDALLFILALTVTIIHPYDAVIIAAVLGSWSVWHIIREKNLFIVRRLAVVLAAASISVLYSLFVFNREPALTGWLLQNVTLSPGIPMYIWGLGIFFFLWFLGMYFMYRANERAPMWILIGIWSSLTWLLIYLPVVTNRRFTNMWFIPVVLVSVYAVRYMVKKSRSFVSKVIIISLVVILGLSGTIWRVANHIAFEPDLGEKYAYFLDEYIDDVLRYSQVNFSQENVILSNEVFISMLVGAYTPTRLYVGHGHQTSQYLLKQQRTDWFMGSLETDQALRRKEDFLKSENISHVVLYKPSMKSDYSWMRAAPFLETVYDSEVAEIFKVLRSQGTD